MKTKNSKKELAILDAYKKSKAFCLRDVYKSWSDEKQNAYNEVMSDCENAENSTDVKILSSCINNFTAGYYFTEDFKRFFKYYTKSNTIIFQVFEGVEK